MFCFPNVSGKTTGFFVMDRSYQSIANNSTFDGHSGKKYLSQF